MSVEYADVLAEWELRYRAKLRAENNLYAHAYVWCPWCKTRARGFRRDGKFMAFCARCGKTWTRHKRLMAMTIRDVEVVGIIPHDCGPVETCDCVNPPRAKAAT